mmetsp:Transcript_12215/g.21685  ORF Transcript_12215/g.21685 Transcript_12215/m.21685 type:complete len:97 (+) Transcript_12215:996-1286(+)
MAVVPELRQAPEHDHSTGHCWRWSNVFLEVDVSGGHDRNCPPSQSVTLWRDAIEQFIGTHTYLDGADWTMLAQGRQSWHDLENKFVYNCTSHVSQE